MLQDVEELLIHFIDLYLHFLHFSCSKIISYLDYDSFYQSPDLFYHLGHLFTDPAYEFSELICIWCFSFLESKYFRLPRPGIQVHFEEKKLAADISTLVLEPTAEGKGSPGSC